MIIKITNIVWDTEDNGEIVPQEELGLPSEVDIDEAEFGEYYFTEDAIIDYLSDEYGYCIKIFEYECREEK